MKIPPGVPGIVVARSTAGWALRGLTAVISWRSPRSE
jgi:hypothetical protein